MHPVLNIYLADAIASDRRREAERFRSTRSAEFELRSAAHLRNGSDVGHTDRRGARAWLRTVLTPTRS
jgi:hypothetical protein